MKALAKAVPKLKGAVFTMYFFFIIGDEKGALEPCQAFDVSKKRFLHKYIFKRKKIYCKSTKIKLENNCAGISKGDLEQAYF